MSRRSVGDVEKNESRHAMSSSPSSAITRGPARVRHLGPKLRSSPAPRTVHGRQTRFGKINPAGRPEPRSRSRFSPGPSALAVRGIAGRPSPRFVSRGQYTARLRCARHRHRGLTSVTRGQNTRRCSSDRLTAS